MRDSDFDLGMSRGFFLKFQGATVLTLPGWLNKYVGVKEDLDELTNVRGYIRASRRVASRRVAAATRSSAPFDLRWP